MTKAKHSGAFKGHRFPPEIISYAGWSYFRFPLSLRDVEDLLAARGIVVSYETIRKWVGKFGTKYAASIRRDRAARRREKIIARFKSPGQAQLFLSAHDQVKDFRPMPEASFVGM